MEQIKAFDLLDVFFKKYRHQKEKHIINIIQIPYDENRMEYSYSTILQPLKNKPGVYSFYHPSTSEVLYVGCSTNLYRTDGQTGRIPQHLGGHATSSPIRSQKNHEWKKCLTPSCENCMETCHHYFKNDYRNFIKSYLILCVIFEKDTDLDAIEQNAIQCLKPTIR